MNRLIYRIRFAHAYARRMVRTIERKCAHCGHSRIFSGAASVYLIAFRQGLDSCTAGACWETYDDPAEGGRDEAEYAMEDA